MCPHDEGSRCDEKLAKWNRAGSFKRNGKRQIRFTPVHFGGPKDAKGVSDDDSGGLSLAGLHYDQEEQVLWVVSDRARAVFVLDLPGRPLAAYDAGEEDLEAIAVIREENRL